LIENNHRDPTHPVWGGRGWKVFLETRADRERTDRYIRDNPVKIDNLDKNGNSSNSNDGWLPRPAFS